MKIDKGCNLLDETWLYLKSSWLPASVSDFINSKSALLRVQVQPGLLYFLCLYISSLRTRHCPIACTCDFQIARVSNTTPPLIASLQILMT